MIEYYKHNKADSSQPLKMAEFSRPDSDKMMENVVALGMIILLAIVVVGLCFGMCAGFVWLLCWGLNAIGIYSIGGVAVKFSWPLVLVFFFLDIMFFSSRKK